MDVANYYLDLFLKDFRSLAYVEPSKWTRATDYIDQMIDFARVLEETGFAYKIPSGLYFDTSKFPAYGELADADLSGLEEGKRIGAVEGRKSPHDFAIWRSYASDDPRLLVYDSPWGRGTPGWHLECSTMSIAELGDRIDIHSGGIDHLNIHHNDEIAQSTAYLGNDPVSDPWVNMWAHHEFVVFGGRKISKSAGDTIRLETLTDESIRPEAYLLFLANAHYRKQVDLDIEVLRQWQSALVKTAQRWLAQVGDVSIDDVILTGDTYEELRASIGGAAQQFVDEVDRYINDDLALPRVRSAFDVLLGKLENGEVRLDRQDVLFLDRVGQRLLGFSWIKIGLEIAASQIKPLTFSELPDGAKAIALSRQDARENKDWESADLAKAQMLEQYNLVPIDTADGTTWQSA